MGRVCVVGSFMYDLIATAPRRPRAGETIIGTGLEMHVGGKGFNQAVASARAGAETVMVGRIGDDVFGAEFRSVLDSESIDFTHVIVDESEGTGVGLPVLDQHGENSIIVVPRANHAVTIEDIERARPVIEGASILLLQLELPLEPTIHAAKVASQADVRVILNPAPYAEISEMAGHIDILVPNEGELGALKPSAPSDDAGLADTARVVGKDLGAAMVVTLGEKGVLVVDNGEEVHIPGHTVRAVDSIGAGDAFCGNLAARLADGNTDLVEAVTMANAAGALSVTRSGGAPSAPTLSETSQFLETRRDDQ